MKLSDGRMPQKAGECLADQDAGYKVGDTIKLRSGTSDEVKDTLTTDTLKVVGLCSSPMYISYGRGSATIGTGTISAFVTPGTLWRPEENLRNLQLNKFLDF